MKKSHLSLYFVALLRVIEEYLVRLCLHHKRQICLIPTQFSSSATFSIRRRSYRYVRYTTNITSAYQILYKVEEVWYCRMLTEHDRTANTALRFLLTKSSSDKCFEAKTYVDSSERFHSDQFKRCLHDLLGFYIRLEVLKAFDHVDVIEDRTHQVLFTGILHVEECLACNWYQRGRRINDEFSCRRRLLHPPTMLEEGEWNA